MRKLASIRTVNELNPIEGADRIEVARLDGWNVIVEKGLHKAGDRVVYFEIDSLLPIEDQYEFLRDRCYVKNPEGFRIRTMKMRGVVSQGLVMPYSGSQEAGTDVTEEYGVTLYEKPLGMLPPHIKGHWPHFLSKTDQERVQNISVPRTKYEVTLKLDGASETVYYNNGEIGVCSRNYKVEQEGVYWEAAIDILNALSLYGKNLAVQGELMGPGIQKNPLGLTSHEIYVFDIWDIDEQRYLYPVERYDTLFDLNRYVDWRIKQVLQLGLFEPAEVYDNEQDLREEILKMADFTIDGKIQEGIVFKGYELPVSFKAINNKYLLKEK
jgi:RNA ligase (TIGR02306 family)